MRRANVISIDPCAAVPELKFSPLRSSSADRAIRLNTSARPLWMWVFPSRDVGLSTSLLLIVARLAVCVVFISMASMTFSLPIFNSTWAVVAPAAALCFCITGFLCRLTMPAIAAIFYVAAYFNPHAMWWLSATATIALLIGITGGGWFSADYFIGRSIRQKEQHRRQQKRLSYKAFADAD